MRRFLPAFLAALVLSSCASPELMLALHRDRNPDGPFQPALCQSPAETGTRWDCSPRKVAQLRREADAANRRQAAWRAAHAIPYEANWDRVAACESGGNWAINTGNGYYGGLQFLLSTWRAYGGHGYPHQNSKAEQIRVAERLRAASGLSPWPVCGPRWYG